MRHKASIILTLTAWFFATGSHWDLVQTFAWGKMFATYAQSMSYTDAARLTFTADNFCGICEIVQEAESSDESHAPVKAGSREIQLALAADTPFVLTPADIHLWSLSDPVLPAKSGRSPPTPPPRA